VMLSAGAAMAEFANVLRYAYRAGAHGFLAGRAIWWDKLPRDLAEPVRAEPRRDLRREPVAVAPPLGLHGVDGGRQLLR